MPDPAAPAELVRPLTVRQCCAAVVGSITGGLRPRRPAAEELATLTDAGLPPASATVRLRALPQLPRTIPTATAAEGVRSPARLRLGLRTFVLEHPTATVLIDPSIGSAIRTRTLASMPTPLRLAVTPPADILSTMEALHRAGIDPSSLDFALPTHLHWDHVSGLLDLPGLETQVHAPDWAWLMAPGPSPVAGVRPALQERSIQQYALDGPPVLTFAASRDLFADGSVLIVDLAGHTPGSVGFLLNTEQGRVLIAGDAAWHHLQVEHAAQKAAYPGVLADEDREETYRSLLRLHLVRDRVKVLPTHDYDRALAWA